MVQYFRLWRGDRVVDGNGLENRRGTQVVPRVRIPPSPPRNYMETLRFLTNDSAAEIATQYGTPTFAYSEAVLRQQAQQFLDIAAPFGQTIRYAMKANPNRHILGVFKDMGLKIDASSGFEAWRAIRAGF